MYHLQVLVDPIYKNYEVQINKIKFNDEANIFLDLSLIELDIL